MRKIELNSKESLQELIARLPIEKRKAIGDLLQEACMAINSVECELQGTELHLASLLDGQVHPTLWCQLYDLKKMFGNV